MRDLANKSTNELFGLSKIGERDTRPLIEKFKVPWYFDTWLSKGFLLFLLVMTVYAIIRMTLKGFW